mmetsp:Transcript_24935/g.36965  ORF Transcript_24935/g.36965 Transcript_24935/m.36965 type:complete len:116 (+) Transcript_24935:891-1238(+)
MGKINPYHVFKEILLDCYYAHTSRMSASLGSKSPKASRKKSCTSLSSSVSPPSPELEAVTGSTSSSQQTSISLPTGGNEDTVTAYGTSPGESERDLGGETAPVTFTAERNISWTT